MVTDKRTASEDIGNFLTAVRNRMYRQTLLQTLTTTFFFGGLLLAFFCLLNRIFPLPIRLLNICWIVMGAAAAAGVYRSYQQRCDLFAVARTVDERLQLRERLTTALGVVQRDPQEGFVRLLLRDAAALVENLDIREICPYRLPKRMKLIPIPLILIGISFTLPTFYAVPEPLTDRQHVVLDQAIQDISGKQGEYGELQRRIRDTLKGLESASDLETAQRHLSDLKRDVRKQQSAHAAIAEAVETTQTFRDMDANRLAATLNDAAAQPEIPPELQTELQQLFERLAEKLPGGDLSDALQQAQADGVTPQTLQDIVKALERLEQSQNLAALESQLTASQKELALATLETEGSGGGIANSAGTPGQDAGTHEVQGTQEGSSGSDFEMSESDGSGNGSGSESRESTPPLTGEATGGSTIDGNPLTLTVGSSGNGGDGAPAVTGDVSTDAPAALPFTEAVLNASRTYAEAVERNRIPLRYQQQIKTYLERIAERYEKEPN